MLFMMLVVMILVLARGRARAAPAAGGRKLLEAKDGWMVSDGIAAVWRHIESLEGRPQPLVIRWKYDIWHRRVGNWERGE